MKFSDRFSLSVNEIHYSNENEALKFIEEIILPYIEKSMRSLDVPIKNALLIFDVFRRQTTDKIF